MISSIDLGSATGRAALRTAIASIAAISSSLDSSADGGMAEYMRIPPTAIVHKIPDGISLEDAAIIEPLACAIHTVNRGDIQLDDVVVHYSMRRFWSRHTASRQVATAYTSRTATW